MNSRTKSKLLLAIRAAAIGSPALFAGVAGAAINGPYTLDGNTPFLFHLDDAAGTSVATNQQTFPGYYNAIGFQQTANNVAGTVNTTILGQAGLTGFGNAATFSGNLMLGYDGNGDGNFSPDLVLTPAAPPNSPDGISSNLFTDAGNGAFTIEAMVRFSGAALAGGGNREVISFDANYNNGAGTGATASRGFQFRVNNSGQLEYNSIGDGDGGIVAAIPTTGANAYAANEWFHVAMVYDGNGNAAANSVRLYWTKMDGANLLANQIGSGSEGDLPLSNNMLVLGNENRNTAGEPLLGLLDEVRISNVARAANQMMFSGAILNYWNNSGSGDWDTASNWTIGVPNAPAAVAIMGGGPVTLGADSTVTLNGTKTVGSLSFDSGFKFTLASGAAGAITLNNGAGVNAVINNVSGSHEIAVPVSLAATAAADVSTNNGTTLTVSGVVSGSGAVNKLGGGTLVLSGANTYTGATNVNAGILRANQGVGLGSGNLSLNGGVLESSTDFIRPLGTAAGQVQLSGGASGFSANGAATQVALGGLATPTALVWGGATFNPSTLILNETTATHALDFKNAIDVNGAVRTVATNANTAILSGIITDSAGGGLGGLTKTGAGRLVLAGANTYAGTTLVSAGILQAAEGVGLSANTNLSINGGQFASSANVNRVVGTAAGQIQLPGGNSGFIAEGADITVTLQNGGVPLPWGSAAFNPGALVLNTATSTNSVTVAGDIDLNAAGRFVAVNGGTATLSGVISGATGGLRADGAGTLVVSNSNTYGGGTIIDSGPQSPAVLRATATNALGTGGVVIGEGGNASTGRLELAGGITLPNAISLNGRNNDSVGIANVSGNNTLSGKISANVGGNRYWISSEAGTLTLSASDPAAAGVALSAASGSRVYTLRGAGDGVVSGVIENGGGTVGVTKDGAGTWTLSGANTYTGATTVNAGKLSFQGNQTTTTSVTVNGGTLELASGGGSNRVIRTGAAAVTGTGKLDLRDNKLVATTAVGTGTANGGAYTAGSVSRMVQTASNGGAWDGPGITTSMPDATGGLTSIGVALASDVRDFGAGTTLLFGGQTITNTDTLAMYTYAGDANLDGQITGDDYSGIDFTIQDPNNTGGWFNGDFNYDGFVSGDDYSAIDFNILAQGAPFPSAGAASLSGVTAVPEPASISLIGLGATALLGRRRRRTK
jgi:autotransporter-associated beta strand protein